MVREPATRRVPVGRKEFVVRDDMKDCQTAQLFRNFWNKFDAGLWEPHTLQKLGTLTEGDLFVDIGAWIGPTTLTAAVNGAKVLAFEPDPVAREELEANIKANPGIDVTVYPVALSNRGGTRCLTAPDFLGDSMSSLSRRRANHDSHGLDVTVDDVRAHLAEFNAARLVKIDVEGGEYRLLPAMRAWLTSRRPDLMLSLHSYHLDASMKRLPSPIRHTARGALAVALRIRLIWLGQVYSSREVETGGHWEPVTQGEFLRALFSRGQVEFYLSV